MIQYWRQVWNTRTNGITNPDFPFGFVQVIIYFNYILYKIYIIVSYQQLLI
jgi:hypothetical protein